MSSDSYSSSFVLLSFCLSVSMSMLHLSKVPIDGAHVTGICCISQCATLPMQCCSSLPIEPHDTDFYFSNCLSLCHFIFPSFCLSLFPSFCLSVFYLVTLVHISSSLFNFFCLSSSPLLGGTGLWSQMVDHRWSKMVIDGLRSSQCILAHIRSLKVDSDPDPDSEPI